MKLYTEKQLVNAIQITVMDKPITYAEVLEKLTPIKLPSEKEIAEKISSTIDASEYGELVYAGALWMLDQIKQQDK